MKKMIGSITGGYVSSAKVVDGVLILSLPDALSPVVWRMDMGPIRSSALEVRDQKDGTFMLTLKTPREDVHDIAPFADKATAVRALMAVSHALEHGQGNMAKSSASSLVTSEIPPPHPVSRQGHSGLAKWISGIAAVLLLFVLISVLAHQSPRTTSFDNAEGSTSSARTSSSTAIDSSPNATGVPVSADDFLRQNSKQ